MITIWKFPVDLYARPLVVAMPKDASILTVQMQGGVVCIWALVDTEKAGDVVNIELAICGTGQIFDRYREGSSRYIGTVQEREFVWHVFVV